MSNRDPLRRPRLRGLLRRGQDRRGDARPASTHSTSRLIEGVDGDRAAAGGRRAAPTPGRPCKAMIARDRRPRRPPVRPRVRPSRHPVGARDGAAPRGHPALRRQRARRSSTASRPAAPPTSSSAPSSSSRRTSGRSSSATARPSTPSRSGRHTLTTLNLPLLGKLIGLPFGGTVALPGPGLLHQPPDLQRPQVGHQGADHLPRQRAHDGAPARVRPLLDARGRARRSSCSSSWARAGRYTTDAIEDFLRDICVARLNDLLGETLKTILDLPALLRRAGGRPQGTGGRRLRASTASSSSTSSSARSRRPRKSRR